ncbi:hypothetical protein [Amycolatopsis regifaucium]|uniref:Terminal beta-(1->2)-arabinofuranosyltransferase C-terminal domain-containing protein n=1 Tax=Amycolatopsis regifaucium TaxID=546365 RepID=A0A154MLW5_9PSEU|nr:hypothetical protein [Amycolatopsis regifaucium]KZB84973.1 hypothetical protein AVL48_01835 [Amycolatopsis regifaucium]OKA03991.1 hypothetical protein ATP06_0232690 [Amycolatopsis regifaucium]SFH98572.1 arabinofuranosyltransferase [Amycolatopsis regifaucium]
MTQTSTTASESTPAWPSRAWFRRPSTWTWLGFGLVLVVYADLAWRRRWMSDDGLIVLRTVRQILAGNGPVFNIGERVETNTSPLWTAILSVLGLIPGVPLEWFSVVTGLLFSVAGLFFGLDGARRLYQPLAFHGLAPAGALVVCALPPFRDFATSGLETGLITLWLGGTWWLLVRRVSTVEGPRAWPVAAVAGLGPLVRPDLALFSGVALLALLVLLKPGRRRAVGLLAAAAALPLAYQVFRMGYYGLLTPNTALVKEAAESNWARGWAYLSDLAQPYWLLVPVLLLAAAVLTLVSTMDRTFVTLAAVPLVGAVLLSLYVMRVGGDFMHGRMLLPALFCLVLPVLAVPVTRVTAVLLVGVGFWALVAAGSLRPSYSAAPHAVGVTDERAYWSRATGHEHPILAKDYADHPSMRTVLDAVRGVRGPAVLIQDYSTRSWYAYPTDRPYVTVAADSMGALGLLIPLDMRLRDGYGLANPFAAHSTSLPNGRAGHQKWLPPVWELANSARLPIPEGGPVRAEDVAAARLALSCPELVAIDASVRDPLTGGRFVDNLVGSFARGSVRFPRVASTPVVCR